jgi:hypothetical protein
MRPFQEHILSKIEPTHCYIFFSKINILVLQMHYKMPNILFYLSEPRTRGCHKGVKRPSGAVDVLSEPAGEEKKMYEEEEE